MRVAFLSLALFTTLLSMNDAGAADLTKVDRTIRREPVYKGKPKYCLMVFGPEAKERVWLVLDEEALYVDSNGNGDLTEEGKRFKVSEFTASDHPVYKQERSIKAGTITVGGLTHAELEVSQYQCRRKIEADKIEAEMQDSNEWQEHLDSIWRQVPNGLISMVTVKLDPKCYRLFGNAEAPPVLHFAWVDHQGFLAFSNRLQDAPVLHFGGPLSLCVNPSDKLRRGNDPPLTTLCLGTPGLGAGAFVTMSYDLVPKDVRPVVEVRFPAKEPGQQPVTRKYVLKERC